MDRAFLKNFGLEEEQISEILDRNSQDIGKALNKNQSAVDKEKLTSNDLKEQLEKANETINNLKKNNEDNKKLQAQINTYKEQIELISKKYDSERITSYTTLKLKESGAINTTAIMPFIDLEKASLNQDGSITGIDEQIDSILTNDELRFLFKTPEEVVPKTQLEQPVRGGYEPTVGEVPEQKSLGAQMAELISNERSNQVDTSAFWDSLK